MTRSLAIAIALVMTASGLALARPRVALMQFDGDPGGEIQDAVSDALDGDLSIVGAKEVNRTADKLGLETDPTDKQLKKLATELEADAVIQGKVSTRGSNKVLHFKLFVHGKKAKGFKVEFASLKSTKFKQALHDKMVEKIGTGGDDDDKATKKKKGDDDDDKAVKKKKKKGDDDDDSKAVKKKKGDDDDDSKAVKKKKGDDDDDSKAVKKKKGDDDDATAKKPKKGDDDDDTALKTKKDDDDGAVKKKKTDDDADEDHPHKAKRIAHRGDDDDSEELHARGEVGGGAGGGHPANADAIRVDGGLSLTSRKLSFNSRNFTEGLGPPPGYKNSAVPGGRIEGELYPFELADIKGPLAGFGLAGEFDQTLTLSVQNTQQPGFKFPVTERHWDIGARYRIPFGAKPTSPTVTIEVGYGHRTFKINRNGLMDGLIIDVPDVDYAAFDPGLELRIPIVPQFAVVLGGSALLVTKSGSIDQVSQYGQAKITAGQGSAGFDIVFGRFAFRVVGEFAQLGFAFKGNGAMANGRDGDPSSPDVGGATDRYIGGAATLAVLY